MSILATGIDMIEIERIERGVARHGDRFNRRFFTLQELTFCEGHASRLAGRFVVKEAVAKALGTGIGDFQWTDVEIVCDGRGKPKLLLHNRARDIAAAQGLSNWSISISHTNTHAIGLAVAIGET